MTALPLLVTRGGQMLVSRDLFLPPAHSLHFLTLCTATKTSTAHSQDSSHSHKPGDSTISFEQPTNIRQQWATAPKAATKRERHAKDASKPPSSQLKSNAAAKTIICKTCRQDFQKTTNRAALEEHASNRHKKTYED